MTPCRRSVHLLLAGTLATGSLYAQETKHLMSSIGWNHAPLSDSTMTARFRAAADEYRQYLPIPRLVFFDIAYPATQAEYDSLGGNAVLLVTSSAQDSTDLPLERVFTVTASGHESALQRIALVCTRLAAIDAKLAAAFGNYRCDALYVMPIAARTQPSELRVDFAAHRRGFRLAQFDGSIPPLLKPFHLSANRTPSDSVLAGFAAREYPGFVSSVMH